MNDQNEKNQVKELSNEDMDNVQGGLGSQSEWQRICAPNRPTDQEATMHFAGPAEWDPADIHDF